MKTAMSLRIPPEILIPIINRVQKDTGRSTSSFRTDDWNAVKRALGSTYGHLDANDEIRLQGTALRKDGKLERTTKGGHGASVLKPSPEMLEYYKTGHWQDFRKKVGEFWDWHCALCYGARPLLDVHHRTYDRLGHEELTDCVLLCRNCHKAADNRRKREMGCEDSKQNDLF